MQLSSHQCEVDGNENCERSLAHILKWLLKSLRALSKSESRKERSEDEADVEQGGDRRVSQQHQADISDGRRADPRIPPACIHAAQQSRHQEQSGEKISQRGEGVKRYDASGNIATLCQ